jgi:hypothetical protein
MNANWGMNVLRVEEIRNLEFEISDCPSLTPALSERKREAISDAEEPQPFVGVSIESPEVQDLGIQCGGWL